MNRHNLKLFEIDGVIIPDDEKRKKVIGFGAYGRVLEVTSSCAAKELHKNLIDFASPAELEALKQKFLQECVQCSKLYHPNIVQFLGVYYPSEDAALPWLVMEKMHISLSKYLEETKVDEVPFAKKISILHNVVQGLHYLHTLDIVHRDLSSNNILLTKSLIAKIADLGVAKMIDPKFAKTHTQTPGTVVFMPPETLQPSPHYGKPVDIFSIGCVFLHTMSHEWPEPLGKTFMDEESGRPMALLETERRQKYIIKFQGPSQLKTLAIKCLADLPKKRPDIDEVYEVFKQIAPELQEEVMHTILSEFKRRLIELEVSNRYIILICKLLPQIYTVYTACIIVLQLTILYVI